MKKLLLGLTLLTSMSSFANTQYEYREKAVEYFFWPTRTAEVYKQNCQEARDEAKVKAEYSCAYKGKQLGEYSFGDTPVDQCGYSDPCIMQFCPIYQQIEYNCTE